MIYKIEIIDTMSFGFDRMPVHRLQQTYRSAAFAAFIGKAHLERMGKPEGTLTFRVVDEDDNIVGIDGKPC